MVGKRHETTSPRLAHPRDERAGQGRGDATATGARLDVDAGHAAHLQVPPTPRLLVGSDAAGAEDRVGLVDDRDHPATEGLGGHALPPRVAAHAERTERPVADGQDGGEVGVDDVTRAQARSWPRT